MEVVAARCAKFPSPWIPPPNRISPWVDALAEGDVLSLRPEVDSQLDLGLGEGRVLSVEPGDFLVVLARLVGLTWDGKGKGVAVLCMTRRGPVPLSRWLVSHWFTVRR